MVDLEQRRAARDGHHGRVCACGSEWFRLGRRDSDPPGFQHGAITVGLDNRITGYAGVPCCIECGEELLMS